MAKDHTNGIEPYQTAWMYRLAGYILEVVYSLLSFFIKIERCTSPI
jgi:hypothetical protein